jgi:hypothetical protein
MVDGANRDVMGGPPPPAPRHREPPQVPFYVAPKRSTVSRLGKVLGPFTPVKASDFERGQVDLDYFIARGVVVKT